MEGKGSQEDPARKGGMLCARSASSLAPSPGLALLSKGWNEGRYLMALPSTEATASPLTESQSTPSGLLGNASISTSDPEHCPEPSAPHRVPYPRVVQSRRGANQRERASPPHTEPTGAQVKTWGRGSTQENTYAV